MIGDWGFSEGDPQPAKPAIPYCLCILSYSCILRQSTIQSRLEWHTYSIAYNSIQSSTMALTLHRLIRLSNQVFSCLPGGPLCLQEKSRHQIHIRIRHYSLEIAAILKKGCRACLQVRSSSAMHLSSMCSWLIYFCHLASLAFSSNSGYLPPILNDTQIM